MRVGDAGRGRAWVRVVAITFITSAHFGPHIVCVRVCECVSACATPAYFNSQVATAQAVAEVVFVVANCSSQLVVCFSLSANNGPPKCTKSRTAKEIAIYLLLTLPLGHSSTPFLLLSLSLCVFLALLLCPAVAAHCQSKRIKWLPRHAACHVPWTGPKGQNFLRNIFYISFDICHIKF